MQPECQQPALTCSIDSKSFGEMPLQEQMWLIYSAVAAQQSCITKLDEEITKLKKFKIGLVTTAALVGGIIAELGNRLLK